ncbi:MAG TPA: beta-galactosidase [Acidimicrobiia bacterium]|nr:beta-galactosidase [Acidimicrobiia bacterium]
MSWDALRPIENQTELWFGGDYNPEQWPAEMWSEDIAALEHLGANTVTLPVFAWSALQPAKDRFEFGWLDQILEALDAHGIGVVMATPTAAQPAWMSAAYPEILPIDSAGRRRRHGGRVNYCPSSSAYREGSSQIATALAERYADFGGLRLWHVNNEYGPVCYCEGCRDEFQGWVKERYRDLDVLNEAWGCAVWGNTLQDWSEIEFPSHLNAMRITPDGWVDFSANPSISLDHARFISWVLLACFLNEKEVLREHTPQVPITTNFHGPVQTIDWHEWGPYLDLVSWDSYPAVDSHWSDAAFGHDLARGAGQRREFLMMETSPGPVNWQQMATLKRPGMVRLQAMQAVARGSRGALFFQVRQARSGNELNHSALIPRHGRLDTRMGAELVGLGRELQLIGVPPDSHHVLPQVALVFDWPSWWANHATPGLDQRSRYLGTVRQFHRVLAERNIVVDIVGSRHPLDAYDVVIAPGLYLVDSEVATSLDQYVSGGGLLITTVGSGIVDASGGVHFGGAEETWRGLVGAWVEETDVHPIDRVNRVLFHDDGSTASASGLFDILRLDTAQPIAEFQDDFYAGGPAVVVNRRGEGSVVYLASADPELFGAVADRYLAPRRSWEVPAFVECVEWRAEGGAPTSKLGPPGVISDPVDPNYVGGTSDLTFLLNHGDEEARVVVPDGRWIDLLTGRRLAGELTLLPGDVVVGRRDP